MGEECTGIRLYRIKTSGKFIRDESLLKPLPVKGAYSINGVKVECNMMLRNYKCALLGDGILLGRCKHVQVGGGH